MWSRFKKQLSESPLAQALAETGADIAQEETQEFVNKLAETPMGLMTRAALARRAKLAAEGRATTAEDVKAWLADCKNIAAATAPAIEE